MMKYLLFILILKISLITRSAIAQEIPFQSMPLDNTYRQELLSTGWNPIPSAYSITPRPKEVTCGASGRLCSALWKHSKTGKTVEFVLWEDSQGKLRVAPYTNF